MCAIFMVSRFPPVLPLVTLAIAVSYLTHNYVHVQLTLWHNIDIGDSIAIIIIIFLYSRSLFEF